MFDLLKWGFTIFSGLAILFSGASWWNSKTNYDRDKDSLKQQVEMFQKQLALSQQELKDSNEKKFSESFVTISNNLQSELISIMQTNDLKWLNIAAAISNNGKIITTNLVMLDATLRASNDAAISNAIFFMNQTFVQIQTNLYQKSDKSLAFAFWNQAHDAEKKSDALSQITAFHNYMQAAIYDFRANDENSARRAINNLATGKFQTFLEKLTKAQFKILQAQEDINSDLNILIEMLTNSNRNRIYDDELSTLKYFADVVREKLSP